MSIFGTTNLDCQLWFNKYSHILSFLIWPHLASGLPLLGTLGYFWVWRFGSIALLGSTYVDYKL